MFVIEQYTSADILYDKAIDFSFGKVDLNYSDINLVIYGKPITYGDGFHCFGSK